MPEVMRTQQREMENRRYKRRHGKNLKQPKGNDEIERARMYEDMDEASAPKEVEKYDLFDKGFAAASSFDSVKSEKSITVSTRQRISSGSGQELPGLIFHASRDNRIIFIYHKRNEYSWFRIWLVHNMAG